MEKEKMKMGVGKSICYMLKTIWDADKGCVIYSFYKNCTEEVFSSFFVIAMMQIIYGYIENGRPYMDLVKFVVLFCSLHVCIHLVSAGHAYYIRLKTPKVYGHVFNKVIEKATHIELTRYEQPDFYDQFSKALDECLTKAMEGLRLFTWAMGCFLSTIAAMLIVAKSDPVMLLFSGISVITSFLCGNIINRYQYQLRNEETKDKRTMEYVKRVFYEKKYAGEIRLYSIRRLLFDKYTKSLDSLCMINKRLYRKIIFYKALQNILLFGITCLCTYLYVAFVIKTTGVKKIGMYVALVGSIDYISWRIKATIKNFVDAGKTCVFMNNLENFLTMQTEEMDDRKTVNGELGDISIEHLSFTYAGADAPVICDLSLHIRKGERIALVGENGAGKTTFVKLLMRLYDVTEGSIEYGGEDIRSYSTKDYRNIIGAVFQDYQLYGATLAENVAMNQIKDGDMENITRALRLADFGGKLEQLPKGLETNMTREFEEDGTMLSGGESQKVAISRMFAKSGDLSIAILDEPSSALDPLAEYKLNKNMMRQTEDATVIFISHRLSTTKDADCIYMFENGRIVEKGTHDELMASGGAYAFMFEKQAHYYQDEIE